MQTSTGAVLVDQLVIDDVVSWRWHQRQNVQLPWPTTTSNWTTLAL